DVHPADCRRCRDRARRGRALPGALPQDGAGAPPRAAPHARDLVPRRERSPRRGGRDPELLRPDHRGARLPRARRGRAARGVRPGARGRERRRGDHRQHARLRPPSRHRRRVAHRRADGRGARERRAARVPRRARRNGRAGAERDAGV
ncbi:MAG: hypothetical protein AVDCRST_MAG40-935, partial [uncultured Gemmatimonadaceae bacterium]